MIKRQLESICCPSLSMHIMPLIMKVQGTSPHFLMFGWHPRLAIDAFLGNQTNLSSSSDRTSYIANLKRRLQFAYKTAAKTAEKASRRHKSRYDLKVRQSVLEPGDRVLLKNVAFRGRHKLENKWGKEPYIVLRFQTRSRHSSICYTPGTWTYTKNGT